MSAQNINEYPSTLPNLLLLLCSTVSLLVFPYSSVVGLDILSDEATCQISIRAVMPVQPILNVSLFNSEGYDSVDNMIDLCQPYTLLIDINGIMSFEDIERIDFFGWFDFGDEYLGYNETLGAGTNIHLCYLKDLGFAKFWPSDGGIDVNSWWVQETSSNKISIRVNISFCSNLRQTNGTGIMENKIGFNNPYSWNFKMCLEDIDGKTFEMQDEFGIYRYVAYITTA